MASNARKHLIPAGADKSFNRATIFETFGNSINDIVPVANTTERAQVVSNLVAAGAGPTSADPLVVIRADAPGLHRIEYTFDGSVWLSDVLSFASKTAADTFGAANGGLLSKGDEARVGSDRYLWSGTSWVAQDTGWIAVTFQNSWITATSGEEVEVRALNGVVYLKGRAASGASGVAFTLPAGFRPKSIIRTYVYSPVGAGASTLVTVNTGGTVVLVSGAQPQLANIAPFPADQ